jgi:hypothetical protein
MYFTIDSDNNITAHPRATDEALKEVAAGKAEGFGSLASFTKAAAEWPLARMVEIWNGMAGEQKVLKFTSKDVACKRIWKAIQRLNAGAETADEAPKPAAKGKRTAAEPKAPKAAKPAREAKAKRPRGPKAEGGSKKDQVVEMLRRKDGATLAEIMTTMDWQAHTVRGFIAGAMKKAGHKVESFKTDAGDRAYRIAS